MNVKDLMTSPAITCPPEAPLAEVGALMREYGIGCVAVVDEHEHLVGIVTDRDLAVRGLSRRASPETPVTEVMSPDVVWIHESADVFDAGTQMATASLRRLPIVEASGRVVGMVSLDDLTRVLLEEVAKLARVVAEESASGARREPTLAPRGADA